MALRSVAFSGPGDRESHVSHGADDAIRDGGSGYRFAIRLHLYLPLYPGGDLEALEQSQLVPDGPTQGKADGVQAVHGGGDPLQVVAPKVVGVSQYDQFRELRCPGARQCGILRGGFHIGDMEDDSGEIHLSGVR